MWLAEAQFSFHRGMRNTFGNTCAGASCGTGVSGSGTSAFRAKEQRECRRRTIQSPPCRALRPTMASSCIRGLGEGEPIVLLLPNSISTLESMRWAEPLTAAGVPVVAYELRGTGRSDRPAPTTTTARIERLAADAIGFAESLVPQQLVVLSGFEAAHHAVRVAVARPAQAVGLVLAGPMLGPVRRRPMQVMWEGLIAKGMSYALRSVADLALALRPEEERAAFARSIGRPRHRRRTARPCGDRSTSPTRDRS